MKLRSLLALALVLCASPPALAQVNPGTTPLSIAKGGTGASTLTLFGILYGNATSPIAATAALTNGQLLVGQTGAAPLPKTATGDVTIDQTGATAIGANKVTNAQFRQSGALSLVGRAANSTGNVADISAVAASSCAFIESGSTIICGQLATAGIANAAVTFAKFQQIAALSMFGNCTNALASGAAVTGTANQVLRVNGAATSCGFGAIDLSQAAAATGTLQTASIPAFAGGDVTGAGGSLVLTIGSSAVTYAKIQNVAASRLLGNPTGAPAAPSEISLGATLAFSGSALQTAALTGDVTATANSFATTIAANAVTNAKMATMAANTVKANATGGSAVPTDVAPATARSSSLLNVDSFTGHGDSIYTILATDRTVGTNAAFTASRTWTLPAANAVNPGQEIVVADFQGTVTGVNTLIISRAGADTINGVTSVTISSANGAYLFKSDGTSKWTAQALGSAAAGGVSSVTCGTGLSGGTITTSGTCAVSLTSVTNSLGSDVAMNVTANYFDGPSVAQGTSGTWLATGTVTLIEPTAGGTNFQCKLWDGTTVIASSQQSTNIAGDIRSISLSGVLATPVANIKISCKDLNATTGKILFNQSGNSKDSTLTAARIQ